VRVVACLTDLASVLGDREAFLCREATKRYEEYVRGRLNELRALLAERAEVKGEIVLVVSGAAEAEAKTIPPEELAALFERFVAEGLTRREAVKEAARRAGLPSREVYGMMEKAKDEGEG
jgi:16S rRNA (cytidine1402-2'-O)-methyltransferase